MDKPIYEMHEFPEYMAKMGHEVHFFDFAENYNSPNFPRVTSKRATGRVRDVELRIHTLSVPFTGLPQRVLAALDGLRHLFRSIRAISPDVVVLYAVPTLGWQTTMLCKILGIPVVFRALDVSHRIRKTRLSWLIKLSEVFVYSTVTSISANNPALADYCSRLSLAKKPATVELPPLDLEVFLQPSHPKPSDSGELPTVLYLGSFFYFSGLDDVMIAMSKLPQPRFRLELIGGGEEEPNLRKLARELSIDGLVSFRGYIPYNQLPKLMSGAVLAINPMKPGLVSNLALPNKVLQYMAAGIPVVSTKLQGLRATILECDGIAFVNDPSQVVDACLRFLDGESDLSIMGEAARARVSELFGNHAPERRFETMVATIEGHET